MPSLSVCCIDFFGVLQASIPQIRTAYSRAKQRLFLLAYGGALVAQEPSAKVIKHDFFGVEGREPKLAMKATLTRLAANPANAVFVVSDIAEKQLARLLRDIPNLGFVVSNGLKVAWPKGCVVPSQYTQVPSAQQSPDGSPVGSPRVKAQQSPNQGLTWTTMSYDDVRSEWLDLRRDIIKAMAPFEVVNGSRLVIDNEVKVEWDFSRADPEWGQIQVRGRRLYPLFSRVRSFTLSIFLCRRNACVIYCSEHLHHIQR